MNIRKTRSGKLLLSAAAVTTAVGLAGVGTFAQWSETESATQTISSGTFEFGTNVANSSTSNVVPGDFVERPLTLTNSGDVDYASLVLTTSVGSGDAGDNLVDASDDDSLRIVVERCAVAWTDTDEDNVYECDDPDVTGDDNRTGVIASADVLGTWDLADSADVAAVTPATTANSVDRLLVRVELPSANTNYADYNGESVAINYSVAATQRDGEAK